MRLISRTLASLLIGNQLQDGRQVQHRLRQHGLQQEPYLRHAERQEGMRVQRWQRSREWARGRSSLGAGAPSLWFRRCCQRKRRVMG
jgi:hypothetical protein